MTEISAVHADITTIEVDAIVNTANTHLQHGGGVAQAIARAGGSIIQAASDDWIREHGPLGPGQAAITPAGSMPSNHVIHVAGPRYREGQDNEALLRQAVGAALGTAAEWGCSSIAIPAISAGIFGYPLDEATRVIAAVVASWCAEHPVLESVLLVGHDDSVANAFRGALTA